MKTRFVFLFLLVLMVLNGPVYAGNPALAQTSNVPTGERVANYFQALMTSAGEMVNAREDGDIFAPKKPFHLAFDYDPERQVIDVYIVGAYEKAEEIKPIFDLVQKLIFRLNNKVQKFYGVTLKPEDLSMDFINVNSGKVVMKLADGKYVDKTTEDISFTSTIVVPAPTVLTH
jgi:hypothetical protein